MMFKGDFPSCEFFNQVDQMLFHLFWDYLVINSLWYQLINCCKAHVNKSVTYDANSCLLYVFGKQNN